MRSPIDRLAIFTEADKERMAKQKPTDSLTGRVLTEEDFTVQLGELRCPTAVDIHDSTKTQAFMDCPRKYFLEFILGLRPQRSSVHLDFGSAFHAALDVMSHNWGKDKEMLLAVCQHVFMEEYRKGQPPEFDEENAPKSPEFAAKGLAAYYDNYNNSDMREEVLYTEVAGVVPLDKGMDLWFKLDRAYIDPVTEKVKVRDYKTGSRLSSSWISQWDLSFQIGAYSYAGHALVGADPSKFGGFEVRGIFFYKSESAQRRYRQIEFQDVPAYRSLDELEHWLHRARLIYQQIEDNKEALKKEDPNAPYMNTFQMHPTNCTKYGLCPFHSICKSGVNPYREFGIKGSTPLGFRRDYWDPRSMSEEGNSRTKYFESLVDIIEKKKK